MANENILSIKNNCKMTDELEKNGSDNMEDMKRAIALEIMTGELVEGFEWACKNYTAEMATIINEIKEDDDGFAAKMVLAMNALKMLDAILSKRVLDGVMEMNELESARIHSIIHAFYFFKDILKKGEEWEDFFLPPTIELENKFQLQKELKKALEDVGIEYDISLETCTFDIEDDMTIKEVKEKREEGDRIIKELTGKTPAHYSDSFFHIAFDFRL